jgi:holliday junction DNA helicase RuvA
MIGKIAGRLDYRGTDHVLIDTGGVGYVVHCSERTLATMPPPGGAVALFTDMLVREDLIQLYGFATLAEREWHRLLTSVQGVSARGGLAILGALGTEGVGRAIALGDVASIRRAPGIGPKIAERIVLELKSRAPAVMAMGGAGARPATAPGRTGASELVEAVEPVAPPAAAGEGAAEAQSDALSALVHLGYAQGEAAAAVATAAAEGIGDPTALIRAALRRLAPQA